MRSVNSLLPKVSEDRRRKITAEDIAQIQIMIAEGTFTLKQIAEKFGVRTTAIRYHTDEKYRQHRIEVVTAGINKKLKDPKERKKQNQRNSRYYHRLMQDPENKKMWNKYHRERHHQHKEIE